MFYSTYSGHPVTCLCVSPRLKKDDESLTIPNVNEGDEGTYTCTVKSEIDQDSASARLTVLGTLNKQNGAGARHIQQCELCGINTIVKYINTFKVAELKCAKMSTKSVCCKDYAFLLFHQSYCFIYWF